MTGFLFLVAFVIFFYYCVRCVVNSDFYQMLQMMGGIDGGGGRGGGGQQPEVTMEDFIQLENQTKVQEVQSNALGTAVAGSYEMLKQAAKNMNSLKRQIIKLEERMKFLEQKEEEAFMMKLDELDGELEKSSVAPAEAPEPQETTTKEEVPAENPAEVTAEAPAEAPETQETTTAPPVMAPAVAVKVHSKSSLMTKKSARVREIAEEVVASTGGPPPITSEIAAMSKNELVDLVLERQQGMVK